MNTSLIDMCLDGFQFDRPAMMGSDLIDVPYQFRTDRCVCVCVFLEGLDILVSLKYSPEIVL